MSQGVLIIVPGNPLKNKMRRATAPTEQPSFVLFERSRRHFWQGTGMLSIKSFVSGEAYYQVGSAAYRLDASSYLILNDGQDYAVTVDSPAPTESFCVFFSPSLAADVFHSLTHGDDALLTNPSSAGSLPEFFEHTFPHDALLSPSLNALRVAFHQRQGDAVWLDEQLRRLLERLMHAHRLTLKDTIRVSASRPATREELYRRLHIARDFIVAHSAESSDIEAIAHAASLSPNHLIRSFRDLFGCTPHQYLVNLRLRRAADLLRTTSLPITDICFIVGYTSLTSFIGAFRQRYGMSPGAYRTETR